jgi:hypothetical protein
MVAHALRKAATTEAPNGLLSGSRKNSVVADSTGDRCKVSIAKKRASVRRTSPEKAPQTILFEYVCESYFKNEFGTEMAQSIRLGRADSQSWWQWISSELVIQ